VTAAEYLRAAEDLPTASVDDIVGEGPLLVLAPHPDDESIGCGGLIAAAAAAGHAVRVMVLTDGAASHPSQPGLAALRQDETYAAAERLGLRRDAIDFLGLPDGALAATEVAVRRILTFCPDPATILATWPHDPHCDHTAAWEIARQVGACRPAARLRAYPVWGWAFLYPIPGFSPTTMPVMARPPGGARLPIAPWLAAKQQAIAAHRSQMGGLRTQGFALPEAMLRLADRPFEIFLEAPDAA